MTHELVTPKQVLNEKHTRNIFHAATSSSCSLATLATN
jgi:hypothetical protein